MTRPHPRQLLLALSVVAAVALAGCASAGGSGSDGRVDQNRISAEELEGDHEADVLTLIQRIRPRWLQPRGSATFGGQVAPAVLIDNMRQDRGLGALRSVRATDVQEVEFLTARDATTRYGTDMAGGAILVTLKR